MRHNFVVLLHTPFCKYSKSYFQAGCTKAWLNFAFLLAIHVFDSNVRAAERAIPQGSNECFVQKYAYRLLINQKKQSLELRSHKVATKHPTRTETTFEIPEGAILQDAVLSKWSNSGLCAIIELKHNDGTYTFRCLCFNPLPAEHEFRINAKPIHNELILTIEENWRVLALNANDYGDGVIALLGIERKTDGMANQFRGTYVPKGAIYTHSCPDPPVAGNLTFFDNSKVIPQGGNLVPPVETETESKREQGVNGGSP